MNAPPSSKVCRVCGKTFAPHGSGTVRLCLGCLFDPVPAGEEEEATPRPATPRTDRPLAEAKLCFAHYEIEAGPDGTPLELGRGAMGVTYRAHDTTLRCAVALKVVSPELADNPRARARFLHEARAAARLRHPHVASVLFFGERPADHQPFYAMELVEGETLQARVRRAGGLPVDAALEIGAQIAGALAAAEAQGLTHRDLKPANVMLVQGAEVHVKIIDFGLAKAVSVESPDGLPLTQTGDFVGTPAFASPEHFNVWQEIDVRSDFYALGATLWYALTGRTPVTGRTLADIRDRQLHAPLPLGQLRAARVPPPLARLLQSLLSPLPADRPQTARALGEALERCRAQIADGMLPAPWRRTALVLAASGVLFAAVLAGWMFHERHGTPALPPSILDKSVAVLPFENLSVDKDSAFFADGVQGEILTDLAKVAELKVISRASVMQYRSDAPRDLREIAAALGVAHLLEGSVQRAGGKVRVSAELIDARTGTQLWAEKYDRPLDDVFAIQSDIAQSITDQLQIRLTAREKAAVEERPTADLAAYDLYLRAKELFDASEPRGDEAKKATPEMVRLLNEAVARDPNFVTAYYLLTRIHEEAHWYNFDPSPAREALAEEALATLVRLRPDAGEAHLARAVHIYHYYDYTGALHELDLAERTLPNNADIFLYRGSIFRRQGRTEECVREYEKGISLNPRGRYPLSQLGISQLGMHRFEDVKRTLDRLVAITPDNLYFRADRLKIDLYSRADPHAAAAGIPPLLDRGPAAAEAVAGVALEVALCTRDAASGARALAATPALEITSDMLGQDFPHAYFEGLVARLGGDSVRAQAAFEQARRVMEPRVAETPDNAVRLIILGTIDASLGRKADAIAEGERCVQVLRQMGDHFLAPYCTTLLAAIYANTGEKDLALARLGEVVNQPGNAYYGFLRLHPLWDPLRGDARFEELLRQAAPPDLRDAPANFPAPTGNAAP